MRPFKTVVIGASGQIGGWLALKLADRGHEVIGTYATVPFPSLVKLDAADLEGAAAWVREIRPDILFYPAGFTWVDGCERDPARAFAANLEQPLNLARAVAEQGGRFVYFSTDYVFNGQSGPYDESAIPHPLSVYGQAKLKAEQALADELGTSQLTARTSWVFGPERQGKNFAYQLARALKAGKSLECPSDQISSPSYAPDVAQAVVSLVEKGKSGLIHVAGPEVMGRVEFAQALAQGLGLDSRLIVSRTTTELGQAAPRPLQGGLSTLLLDQILPGAMRPLEQAIRNFVKVVHRSSFWTHPTA